jgi:ribosomal protein S18 acetylase RimI-like enzyme
VLRRLAQVESAGIIAARSGVVDGNPDIGHRQADTGKQILVSTRWTVRIALASDLGFLVDANLAMALETERRRLDPAIVTAGVRAVLAQPSRLGDYFIARDSQRSVGCLLVTSEWSDWRNGYFWWIQSVYVLPAYRRQGVYTALHDEVLARARQHGKIRGIRLYVDMDNRAAQDTYSVLGMARSNYALMEQLLDPEPMDRHA